MKLNFKHIILFIFALSSCLYIQAQNTKIDSLLILIKKDKEDSIKVKHLIKLSIEYGNTSNYIDGLNYGKQAIALANKQSPLTFSIKKDIATSYNVIGNMYSDQGNYQEALKNYLTGLKIRIENKDKQGISYSYNNIGNVYMDQGNYSEALKNHLASLKMKEEIGDKYGIATSYNNIGNILEVQKNYAEALKDQLIALKIREEIDDKQGVADSRSNIGNIQSSQRNYTTALKNYLVALKIREEIGDKSGIANCYNNIGLLYEQQGNYSIALKNYLLALKINEEIGANDEIALSCTNIGWIQLHLKKLINAQNYFNRALQLNKLTGNKEYIKSIYEGMAVLDSAMGNFKAAYEDYKLFFVYKDSVDNEESRKKTIQQAMQYEFDKKEAVTKAEHEKQVTVAEAENRRQQIFIWLVVAVALAISIIAIIVMRSLRKTKKQKIKIESQKVEIEMSHKKVSDSINYAQKIQYSILPSEEEIEKYIPEYFVYFQPKDIISGDFYWFYHHNGFSYAAVADCTGHGVPGALMSMTIHSLLNEVMMEEKLTNPGEILSRLHRSVYKTLQQHKGDEYSQDGCDISLSIIDHANKLLHFSGARNHAYLTNGENITVIKATSKSIGGLSMLGEPEPERKFKSETIELKEDVLLVMSTDGIFDQLNNQDESFGNTRFKEMINTIYHQPINKGNEIVTSSINDWKKDLHPQDDMLVMGFKLKF